MNLTEVAKIRLKSQHIVGGKYKKVKDIVQWMCAMQAQDFAMAKWAIGVRLPGSTIKQIETSIDKAEIIRTHLLRPTWHFASAKDIYWLLELSSPQIWSSSKSRNKQLELTSSVIARSNEVMRKALAPDKHLTRDELIAELLKAKIQTDDNRASHLLLCAELDKIICSGSIKNNKQTFALFDKRVLQRNIFHREEAISKLAKNYFQSHSPATLQDFSWWSGLPAKEARLGLENIKSGLISETIDSLVYWVPDSFSISETNIKSVQLLPAFDEYLISYKNRSASISPQLQKNAVSDNGIFRPIIVVNGQVTGIWKRIQKKDNILIETDFFRKHTKAEINGIEKSAELYGHFTGKKITVENNNHSRE